MNKKIHSVKILPTYFEAIISGEKTFEVRFNDRDYAVGDILRLREFENDKYTGREALREICYMLDDSSYCLEGYVVLGIRAKVDTRGTSTLEDAIDLLKKEYERAKNMEYVKKPLAWALFQVWKKADKQRGGEGK